MAIKIPEAIGEAMGEINIPYKYTNVNT